MGYDAWGQVRVRGDLQTDIGYTGQREDVGINAMFYRARFYSPALGRFLSADTIVPGAADGSGGGAGTLGYDKSTRLTPLSTNFHEFIAQVGSENAEVLHYGPFVQWSDKVRKEHNVPTGPLNPQALNRYSYVLNNPLRYVDPSGHCPWCIFGLIGAAAGAIGNFIGQVVQGEGNLQERVANVDWGNVAIAGGVGFVAGATGTLVTTPLGAIALGADANAAQYLLTQASNNEQPTALGLGLSAGSGAMAGWIIGPAAQVDPTTILWDDAAGTLLDKSLAHSFNQEALSKVAIGAANIARNIAGSMLSNFDYNNR